MSDAVDNTTHKPRSNTAKRNKSYGFNAESELLQFLRDHFCTAERLYLTGKEDEGDLLANVEQKDGHWETYLIQLKTFSLRTARGGERPLTPGRIKGWLADLNAQRAAYAAHRDLSEAPEGILIVKFKGYSWEDALVITQLKEWLG